MIKDKAKSVVRKKTSGSVKQQKRSGSISTELSQNCRCICSSVCSIEGPDSITAGTEKTYTLEVRIARNLGCVPDTGACVHNCTKWTKGGPRGTAVTLKDDKRSSVKVKVAAGTHPGAFWLQAQPETTCRCKGPDDIVRDCSDQPEKVTINII
ncbi:MAG: hypothetical protein Q8M56_00230 [Desulfobacterales bacterium]|nr:hypothetical protein [Desulfobacterales bacterium]